MNETPNPAPENFSRAKHLYENGEASVATICAMLKMTPKVFYRMRKIWGWTGYGGLRAPKKQRAQSRKTQATTAKKTTKKTTKKPAQKISANAIVKHQPSEGASLAASLRQALECEIATLRTRMAGGEEVGANVRTLNTLTRTLASLSAMEAKDNGLKSHDDDAPPLDLAELRRELARRIDSLRTQRMGSETD